MKKNLLVFFCFFTFGIIAQIPTYVPSSGLIGYFGFNGNATDAITAVTPTINTGVLISDRFGNANAAYQFNGNQIIKYGSNHPLGQIGNSAPNFTINFWLKISASQIAFPIGSFGWGYYVRIANNQAGISYVYAPTGSWITSMSNSTVNSGCWKMITISKNVNTLKIYINGILDNTINLTSSFSTYTSNNSWFGANGQDNNAYLNGSLDDVGLWNRELNQTEITNLYQNSNEISFSINQTQNLCASSVLLDAGSPFQSYLWSTGATTQTITVTQSGNYSCSVNTNGCSATQNLNVTVQNMDTLTWTGNVDNDWHKPCNWSPEVVPECCNSVKIPFTPISPVVSGVGKAKNITLYSTSGATLNVNNGANLQIETCPVTKTQNSCPTLPVITTTAISNISQISAASGGNITYSGVSSITTRGVCWSTTTAPTIANSKTTDGSGIGSFTSNLNGLTAGTTYYVRAYATNANGTSYGNEVSFIAVNPQPAYPLGSVYCNGTPTLIVDVTNPTTGKTWMDRNLGASQAATSSTDANAYGDLYQWGRGSDGHQCRSASTTSSLSSSIQPTNSNYILAPNTPYDWLSPQNTNLWQNVNGINNPCPSGYRIPTNTEQNTERLSWSVNTSVGAFSSPLKLTVAGYRFYVDGAFHNVNLLGHYWSSVIDVTNSIHLAFSTSNAYMFSNYRSGGFSVRCIKN